MREGMYSDDIHSVGWTEFMEFGRRIGIPETLARREIIRFAQDSPMADSLIDRSFLSDSLKKEYRESLAVSSGTAGRVLPPVFYALAALLAAGGGMLLFRALRPAGAAALSLPLNLAAAPAAAGGPIFRKKFFLQCRPVYAIVVRQSSCRCSSMAECQLPKLNTRVRFPSPAPCE